ncbi:Hypothetical protein DAL_51 [Psychrobacter phage D'Alembert]|nr:Hypothetical protein DAL_51 [Psychrobacter phage D'Alembert]
MITKLYLYLLHWLEQSLPSPDDTYIKCATCGWDSEHMNSLKFIYVGNTSINNEMEGLCPSCYGGILYHKKDWRNLKARNIPLTLKVYFKGGNI